MSKIFIDPGHGGKDPGAVGHGLREKDVVLNIALKTGNILKSKGHKVYYSRTNDKYVNIYERAKMSNNVGADIFVSIHTNSFSDEDANGTETLYYPSSGKGKSLAQEIQNEIIKIGGRDRGIKERPNLVVLNSTKMPAVLVETMFISNKKEAEMLRTRQNEFAQFISDGILSYLGSKKTGHKSFEKPKGNTKKSTWEYYIIGEEVKNLQRELNIQFNKNLKVDGYFGDKTISALVNVRRNARGNLTKIIQRRLREKGYSIGRAGVDGIFGRDTENAVKRFQKDNGLKVDGIVGRNTWKELFRK